MSQIGNIEAIYGKKFNILSANVTSTELLSKHGLPATSIIYAAPTDDEGNDLGTYSMIMTDSLGDPIRLTYTIKEGNGLITDNDIVKLVIDNNSITADNKLFVNKDNIIDNKTIANKNNKLQVITSALDITSKDNLGISKIDNNTLKLSGDILYCEASNLNYASEDNFGVVRPDNKTLKTDIKGIITAYTGSLTKATKDNYGISKPDNTTIIVNKGVYSVNTGSLKSATSNSFGISRTDNKTISNDNGIYSVVTSSLDKASDKLFGVVRTDNNSLIVNNGILSVNNYEQMIENSEKYKIDIQALENRINLINNLVNNHTLILSKSGIYKMDSNQATTSILNKPQYLEEPINMPEQYIYFSFNVITNCDFHINVNYVNNDAPGVEITQVNYNDEFTIDGATSLNYVYPSTNMNEKEITIQFGCRNFSSMTEAFAKTTKIQVIISNKDNNQLNETLWYSILRYNSYIKESEYIESLKDKYNYYESNISSFWYLPDNPEVRYMFNSNTPENVIQGSYGTIVLHLVYTDDDNNVYCREINFDVENIIDKYSYGDNNISIFYTLSIFDPDNNQHDLTWQMYFEATQMDVVILQSDNELCLNLYKGYTTTIPVLSRTSVTDKGEFQVTGPASSIILPQNLNNVTCTNGSLINASKSTLFRGQPYYNVLFNTSDSQVAGTFGELIIKYNGLSGDSPTTAEKLCCGVIKSVQVHDINLNYHINSKLNSISKEQQGTSNDININISNELNNSELIVCDIKEGTKTIKSNLKTGSGQNYAIDKYTTISLPHKNYITTISKQDDTDNYFAISISQNNIYITLTKNYIGPSGNEVPVYDPSHSRIYASITLKDSNNNSNIFGNIGFEYNYPIYPYHVIYLEKNIVSALNALYIEYSDEYYEFGKLGMYTLDKYEWTFIYDENNNIMLVHWIDKNSDPNMFNPKEGKVYVLGGTKVKYEGGKYFVQYDGGDWEISDEYEYNQIIEDGAVPEAPPTIYVGEWRGNTYYIKEEAGIYYLSKDGINWVITDENTYKEIYENGAQPLSNNSVVYMLSKGGRTVWVKYENGRYLRSDDGINYDNEITEEKYNDIVNDPATVQQGSGNNNIPEYMVHYDTIIGTWYKFPDPDEKNLYYYVNIDIIYNDAKQIYKLSK